MHWVVGAIACMPLTYVCLSLHACLSLCVRLSLHACLSLCVCMPLTVCMSVQLAELNRIINAMDKAIRCAEQEVVQVRERCVPL